MGQLEEEGELAAKTLAGTDVVGRADDLEGAEGAANKVADFKDLRPRRAPQRRQDFIAICDEAGQRERLAP